MKPKNYIIEELGDLLKVDISTETFQEAVLRISREDWQTLLKSVPGARWTATGQSRKGGYEVHTVAAAYRKGKRIFAHRVLFPDCQAVRFLNGNKLDLRRDNMQPCRLADCRTDKAHADSQTGIKNITPSGSRFRLDHRHAQKSFYIGSFETIEEAQTVQTELQEVLPTLTEAEAVEFLETIRD